MDRPVERQFDEAERFVCDVFHLLPFPFYEISYHPIAQVLLDLVTVFFCLRCSKITGMSPIPGKELGFGSCLPGFQKRGQG